MAIVQAVIAAIFRSAGKILNTAVGWATVMLFGKPVEGQQIYLSAMSLGSILWIVALIGIAFPAFATWLLAFVRLPDWFNREWVRPLMIVAALVIPLAVGALLLFLPEREQRPKGLGQKITTVLRGYRYTSALAVTLLMLLVVAPVMKLQDIVRRWTTAHVPVVVKPEDYSEVVDDLQEALHRGGIEAQRAQASWMLRVPTSAFTWLAGGGFRSLVARDLAKLKSDKVEVMLHPSDLIISGREMDVARARAVLSEHLSFTKAYRTWEKETMEVEDRLRSIWRGKENARSVREYYQLQERLKEVEQDIHRLEIPYEEWEALFREKLLVERSLLSALAAAPDQRPGRDEDQDALHFPPRIAVTAGAGLALGALASLWVARKLANGDGFRVEKGKSRARRRNRAA